ncbi:MAG TPA: SpoIID/LytB domain-containing protein [Actinomycetota bacterium]
MTRRTPIPLLLVAALVAAALLPSPAARAASGFTFYGSGYGHGIGMSQWGALGLARMGWDHERIVTHFYRGTQVRRVDDLPARIRVGVAQGRRSVRLRAVGGPVRLWVGAPGTGTSVGPIPAGATWKVNVSKRSYAVRTGGGNLVGGRTWGGPARHLYATYDGARVFVPEADDTWGRGFAYGRGHLEFNLYGCAERCSERVIVPLRFEEYLYGLGEVPSSWLEEALRAQAVAARSFAAATIRRQGGLRAGCNCHLSDGAGDQVYIGWNKEGGPDGDRWVRAVRDTAGAVVTYGGQVVQAFYAASDGGHSEDVEDVWHGGDPDFAVPWLRGVCDPGESTSGNPWTDWEVTFGADALTSRLRPYTGAIGTVTRFASIRRGRSGRIVRAVVRGTGGSATIRGSSLRSALGLRDTRVWINADRTIAPGPIRERYDASMCRPGLPTSRQVAVQGGRQQLFRRGGIFRNDDRTLTIWLRGPIFREYAAVGTGRGVLGLPTSKVRSLDGGGAGRAVACAGCSRISFRGGRIYLKPGVGAHALWGRVLERYLARGGPGGALGFPTSRVGRLPGGGRGATFEGGRIECPAGADCVVTLA